MELTDGSFQGMVHPEDLGKIQNQIQAQTLFGEKRHDYVRYRIDVSAHRVTISESLWK